MLRGAALVAGGSLAVHELRYIAGYGSEAGGALAAQGHSYLAWVGPLVAAVIAVACGVFIASLAAGHRDREPARMTAVRVWALASASLTAIYLIQETLEGVLATGHPSGVAGVLADGGWTAVLFAIAIGAAIALMLRGARAVEAAAARLLRPALTAPAVPLVSRAVGAVRAVPRTAVLARHLAGRAPPLPS